MPKNTKNSNWRERFEKKHWGAMFEDGDFNALLKDIESLLKEVIEDIPEDIMTPGEFGIESFLKQQLKAKYLRKENNE